jgi:hypothetical protein
MYDIKNFSLKELTECGIAIRNMANNVNSMEEVANKIVTYLFTNLSNESSKACALVRLFKTHPFAELEPELKKFVLNKLGTQKAQPTMKCLTLLGTAGENEEWNSRKYSEGHKAIPLPSAEILKSFPMISNLVKQVGLPIEKVLVPDKKIILDIEQKSYNVFIIEDANNSRYIPAQQDFVIPYNIKTVIGFGGILPSGDMFAVILFFKIQISREIAEMFKTLSLNAKMALLPFEDDVFTKQ